MFKIVVRPDLDMNDVGTSVLINEIVALQQTAFQKYGDDMCTMLENVILPSLVGQGPYIQTYIQQLRSGNTKEFKDFFKNFVKAYRKEKMR